VTTTGIRYFAAIGSYSRNPITEQTWPAARKPCTRFVGDERIASIAGGTRTCETRSEKFPTPAFFACQAAMALAGAVVSNPTAKKTTSLAGFLRAISRASSGE
jgi:hypothetical protein